MKDDFDAFPVEFLKELLQESKIIFTNEVEREIIERLYGCNTIRELFEIGNVDILVTTLGKTEASAMRGRTAGSGNTGSGSAGWKMWWMPPDPEMPIYLDFCTAI